MSKLPKVFCNTNKLVNISKLEVDVSLLMNIVFHNKDDMLKFESVLVSGILTEQPVGFQGEPPSHLPSCNLKSNVFELELESRIFESLFQRRPRKAP